LIASKIHAVGLLMRDKSWPSLYAPGLLALVLGMMLAAGPHGRTANAADNLPQQQGSASGLSLPRFVSLKSDRVNLRNGPGTDYPTSWVFRRAGMPVEVLKEFEAWRQVRDAEGATGWVLHSMLSGRRTALVLPWELKPGQPAPQAQLRSDDRDTANVVAVVEAGVIANIRSCDRQWCYVVIGDFRGYIEQAKLWGVYAGEVIR
jgi:SH3-like domain-containing protein